MLVVLAALTCFEPKILISRKGWLLGSTSGQTQPQAGWENIVFCAAAGHGHQGACVAPRALLEVSGVKIFHP